MPWLNMLVAIALMTAASVAAMHVVEFVEFAMARRWLLVFVISGAEPVEEMEQRRA